MTNKVNGLGLLYLSNVIGEYYFADGYGGFILANCDDIIIGGQNINDSSFAILAGYCRLIQITHLSSSNNIHAFAFFKCSYVYISKCNLSSNLYSGLVLNGTTNSYIQKSLFFSNHYGILAINSSSNSIFNNTFTGNNEYAIKLNKSTMNFIHHNNFISNGNGTLPQCYADTIQNRWNDTTEGNYWNDWTTPDTNQDGIVDFPYNISGIGGKDYYPLTNIHIANNPPIIISINVTPLNAYFGENISFACTAYDEDSTSIYCVWSSNITGNFSSSFNFNYSSLPVGLHKITVVVYDSEGAFSQPATVYVTVINVMPNNSIPIAVINSIFPSPGIYGHNVYFTGTGIDSDGTIVAYNWTSSIDGFLSSNSSFSTNNLSIGIHNITFAVMDNLGAWSQPAYFMLSIEKININTAPNASIISIHPTEIVIGQTVYFIGLGTDDGSISAYSWVSSIDGTIGNAQSFNTSRLSLGTHNITFKVCDDSGLWSLPVYATVIVKPAISEPPTASILAILPSPSVEGQNVLFCGKSTQGSGGEIVAHLWVSSLDGIIGTNETVTTNTLSVGMHVIYYMSKDASGVWSETAVAYHLVMPSNANNIPSVTILNITPSPAVQGAIVSFSGSAIDTDGNIVEYYWFSTLDGKLNNTQSFSTTSLSVGTHIIYFTAKDNNGVWANPVTKTLQIVLINKPPVASITNVSHTNPIENETIILIGLGYDSDGYIVSFNWTSNIDGFLGNAQSISVNLSKGTHVITLRVLDNNGSWSEPVNITIYVRNANAPPKITAQVSEIVLKNRYVIDVSSWASDEDNAKGELTWNVTMDTNSPLFSVSIQNGTNIILTNLGKSSVSAERTIYLRVSDPEGANDSVSLKVIVKKISTSTEQIGFNLFLILILILLAIVTAILIIFTKKKEGKKIELIVEPSYENLEVGKPEYTPISYEEKTYTIDQGAQEVKSYEKEVEYSASYSELPVSETHYAIGLSEKEQPEIKEEKKLEEIEGGKEKEEVKETDIKETGAIEDKKDKIEGKKERDTEGSKYASLPAELAEKTREIDLGLEICESLKFDVEKPKNARNKIKYNGDKEKYLESIKIVELYLKIALKKGLPGLIKDAENCINELEKKGEDASTLKSALSEIEGKFAEGDYQKLISSLGKIVPSYALIESIKESSKRKTETAKESETGPKSTEQELKKDELKPKEKELDTKEGEEIKESPEVQTTKKIARDRLVFLDGRVYIIFESDVRKSYRILKGISEEGAWVSWLTLDAENVIKKYSVPPNIKVKGLGNETNLMESLLNEIIEYGKGTNRFAMLVDFIVSFMTAKNIQSTLRLLSAIGKLIKGKQACILIPISSSLLSKEEVSEFKKVATIIENPNPHINWLESPDRTITSVVKCHVCMGVVKANLPIYICPCGKKFHDTCAKRVGECPACGRKIS